MQDDQVKQHRLKENEEFYISAFKGFRDLIRNFSKELTKDKSGLRIYQDPNGITPEPPKTGLRIFREGGLKEVAKAAVDNVVNQVSEVAKGIKTQATDAVLDTVDVAARNFVKDREVQRQGGQMKSIEQDLAEVIAAPPPKETQTIAPPATEPAKKKEPDQPITSPAAEPAKEAETDKKKDQSATPPAAETTKVKDRLLYADNNLKPEMTMPDMLAVAELFTAKRGDQLAGLAGDAAKNLVVEFNGHLLLKTDKEGQVQINNLQNQEILSNFTFREKNQIAESIAQFEALKPQLKQAIQLQTPADMPKLVAEIEKKVQDSKPNLEKAEAQTPAVLPATSPPAQEMHQGIGSKRIEAQTPAPSIEQQTPDVGSKPPQSIPQGMMPDMSQPPKTSEFASIPLQVEPRPTAKAEAQEIHKDAGSKPIEALATPTATPTPEMLETYARLAGVVTVAFNANYKGETPAQGSIQTPSGTIIHKTIVDQETRAFDISIERDGQNQHVASYRNGAWIIQEGMIKADPLLREISTQINSDGEFMQPEVRPRQEIDDRQQANEQQYEPERDYAR
jgi:hypothetical protein